MKNKTIHKKKNEVKDSTKKRTNGSKVENIKKIISNPKFLLAIILFLIIIIIAFIFILLNTKKPDNPSIIKKDSNNKEIVENQSKEKNDNSTTESSKAGNDNNTIKNENKSTTTNKDYNKYICPSGFVKSDDGKTCKKIITSNIQYSCPGNYNQSADKKTCSRVDVTPKDKLTGKWCSWSNYTYSDGVLAYKEDKCYYKEVPNINNLNDCNNIPGGYTYHFSTELGKCYHEVRNAGHDYSCRDGYSIRKVCDDTICSMSCAKDIVINATKSYSCPDDYTMSSNKTTCYITINSTKKQ